MLAVMCERMNVMTSMFKHSCGEDSLGGLFINTNMSSSPWCRYCWWKHGNNTEDKKLTSWGETDRHTQKNTHKRSEAEALSLAEGRHASVHVLRWLTKSNRHQNNFLLFTKTTMSNCNIVFWTDQTVCGRKKHHVQMGRNRSATRSRHQQQWYERDCFIFA